MGRKIELEKTYKANVKWKVLSIDYSAEEEKNIRAKFAEKYGIPKENVKVEPEFYSIAKDGTETSFTNDIGESIQSPEAQQALFPRYFEERGIKDYDLDKLCEIDNIINAQINYETYEKNKRYTIKWMRWSNFMSYGPENYFDFTTLKGLVLLSSEPANEGGKTTFCLDLFRFLLFGKITDRENKWTLSKAFNRHLPEATECIVEGCISVDGIDYVIKRTITRPSLNRRTDKNAASQKVAYYRLINGTYVDLEDAETCTESSGRETNKAIKDAIGNESDFDLMICVDADNLKKLISLKDTERGRLISRWIGLLPLEEKDKLAREYYNKSVTPKLLLNRYNKEELKVDNNEIETENDNLRSAVKDYTKKLDDAKQNLKDFEETKETLLQSKREIDDSLAKADVETVKKSIVDITENGKRKAAEKAGNEEKYKEVKGIDFNEAEYKEKVQMDKNLTVALNNALTSYSRIKNEIVSLQNSEFCPTCGARLKGVDNTEAIEAKKKELSELKDKGAKIRADLENVQAEISNLEEHRNVYNEKLRLELIIEKNELDIENLRSKLREAKRLMSDIEKNSEAIENNNRINTQMNVVKANIENEKRIIETYVRNIADCNKDITENEKIISTNKKMISTIEEEEILVKNWKMYLEIIGKNGISKILLRSVLPVINGELKHLLNDICDFEVEVAIDERNDVAFYIIQDGIKSDLASGSGFEKTAASLALRSVLSKVSTFSKPSFVIFDEVLGGVADENYDKLKALYDMIVKDYSHVFHICHIKQLADWHDMNIIVKKTNRISKIEMA